MPCLFATNFCILRTIMWYLFLYYSNYYCSFCSFAIDSWAVCNKHYANHCSNRQRLFGPLEEAYWYSDKTLSLQYIPDRSHEKQWVPFYLNQNYFFLKNWNPPTTFLWGTKLFCSNHSHYNKCWKIVQVQFSLKSSVECWYLLPIQAGQRSMHR